jgi:Ricin-type beta-trefoil lectin domain-like
MNNRRFAGSLLAALTTGLLTAAIVGQSASGIPVGGPPTFTTTVIGTPTPSGTKIVNNGSALCIQGSGNGNAIVTQVACSGQISLPALQQIEWNVVSAGSGTVLFRSGTFPYVHVVNVFSGKCLTDVGASSASGAATDVEPCSSSTSMAWTQGARSPDNDLELVNAASGGCLQPSQGSSAKNTAVVQDPCVGSTGDFTQFWSGLG